MTPRSGPWKFSSQDADAIAWLSRDEYYLRDKTLPEQIGIAEILVSKNRNGPTESFKLSFQSKETRFEDLDHFS